MFVGVGHFGFPPLLKKKPTKSYLFLKRTTKNYYSLLIKLIKIFGTIIIIFKLSNFVHDYNVDVCLCPRYIIVLGDILF
jgi:hypothetical protein